jgi:hypothetical protein
LHYFFFMLHNFCRFFLIKFFSEMVLFTSWCITNWCWSDLPLTQTLPNIESLIFSRVHLSGPRFHRNYQWKPCLNLLASLSSTVHRWFLCGTPEVRSASHRRLCSCWETTEYWRFSTLSTTMSFGLRHCLWRQDGLVVS